MTCQFLGLMTERFTYVRLFPGALYWRNNGKLEDKKWFHFTVIWYYGRRCFWEEARVPEENTWREHLDGRHLLGPYTEECVWRCECVANPHQSGRETDISLTVSAAARLSSKQVYSEELRWGGVGSVNRQVGYLRQNLEMLIQVSSIPVLPHRVFLIHLITTPSPAPPSNISLPDSI